MLPLHLILLDVADVVVPIMVFSIPIIAILSGVWLKHKKMEMESRSNTNPNDEQVLNRLKELEAKQQDLGSRLKNLELIVADSKKLDLGSPEKSIDFKQQLDELKHKVEELKKH